jgi:hypothetical protein
MLAELACQPNVIFYYRQERASLQPLGKGSYFILEGNWIVSPAAMKAPFPR